MGLLNNILNTKIPNIENSKILQTPVPNIEQMPGLVGEKAAQLQQSIQDGIQNGINNGLLEITKGIKESVLHSFLSLADKAMAVVSVGIVGYMIYICIQIMFVQKKDGVQKLMFTTFGLILARIFNVLIRAGL